MQTGLKNLLRTSLVGSVLVCVVAWSASRANAEEPVLSRTFLGAPLSHWIEQTKSQAKGESFARMVEALCQALRCPDPALKVAAADALANLGPAAMAAMPALLEQLQHEFPWVREPATAALAALGKEAVPALTKAFATDQTSVRIRVAFVLGAIGPDAQAAVPVLAEAMAKESPVIQQRLAGILAQIDPAKYASRAPAGSRQAQAAVSSEWSAQDTDIGSGDWPQFHGPARDARSREQGLLDAWPEGGPQLLWRVNGLGRGYSTVSIAGNRLFTMGDRATEGQPESQYVIACDLPGGRERWATRVGPPHPDGGPRCTPTVDGGLLYVLGTDGDLLCLDTDTGGVRWQRNLARDFGGQMMSVWKYSESPLIDGQQLVCTPGGPEATMVALNKHRGELLWKSVTPKLGDLGADGAGYSSAVAANLAGVRQYVQLVGRGAIGVEATSGRFLWGYNKIANTVANITTPAVRGDFVFVTTAYNMGAALLKISRQEEQFQAEEVYFISPKDFQNHHGGVVLVENHFYGGSGANRGEPTCIEFGTGRILWKEKALARGSAAVLYADGDLIFRYDRGEVFLIEATPQSARIKARFLPPLGDGPAWPHPVIHQGKLYLRHGNTLLCYELRTASP